MGRYYSGDIEGKFWFGVQASEDASFFGGEVQPPNTIDYVFTREHDLESINAGIEMCYKELGDLKEQLDQFFASRDGGYNGDMIVKYWKEKFGVTLPVKKASLWRDAEKLVKLEWYARLLLGEKIKKQVKEHGTCCFEAEL